MRCETCQGMGTSYKLAHIIRVDHSISPGPCPDCGGSGIAHCCDGIQEQRDPGDETSDWPDRLGEMERDVTGCADDCRHPSHNHSWTMMSFDQRIRPSAEYVDASEIENRQSLSEYLQRAIGVLNGNITGVSRALLGLDEPDTHDEWRKLNEGE